ncbi:MAG: hypothetical protein M1404_01700 [Acidobacteria bacterium]|nr:hypothetical protein [Acidobacteriota bacterium]
MIGMHFGAFLTLLIVSVIGAGVVHYGFRYRFVEGIDGFLGKWIVSWVAAWVASPVMGYWFGNVKIANVYLIPALLGAFAGAFMTTLVFKALAKASVTRMEATGVTPVSTHETKETRAA